MRRACMVMDGWRTRCHVSLSVAVLQRTAYCYYAARLHYFIYGWPVRCAAACARTPTGRGNPGRRRVCVDVTRQIGTLLEVGREAGGVVGHAARVVPRAKLKKHVLASSRTWFSDCAACATMPWSLATCRSTRHKVGSTVYRLGPVASGRSFKGRDLSNVGLLPGL